ncbi:MAG: SixA phosphatase family protein [Pyrinomonadaceae bacterium]
MKTLYLLRHAKSSWDDPNLSDFDRPLNKRGLTTAPKMGVLMRKRKLQPDLILSSPAARAKETTRLVSEAAGLKTEVRYEQGIYEASVDRLLKIVSQIDESVNSAMLVGHNPGFEELLAALTSESQRMSTAALACIELDVPGWSDVAAGRGKLEWFVKPKDLK